MLFPAYTYIQNTARNIETNTKDKCLLKTYNTKGEFMKPILSAIIIFFTFVCFAGCDSFRPASLHSKWRQQEIVIDGIDSSDWKGAGVYVEGGDKLGISLINDKDFLYMRLISMDQMLKMRMLRQGVIVWFDSTGGKAKYFGIHYPIGAPLRQMQNRDEMDKDISERPSEGELRNFNPQNFLKKAIDILNSRPKEAEVLGHNEKEQNKLIVSDTIGFNLALGAVQNKIVYELKIPLTQASGQKYYIGKGDCIGLGIEIPKIEMSGRDERMGPGGRGGPGGMGGMGGGPPGGGMGGGMGGMGGGGMGGGPGGRGGPDREAMGKIEVWDKIKLATTPDNATTSKNKSENKVIQSNDEKTK